MSDIEIRDYQALVKKAWIVYALITLVIILILVFLVARDLEEQFFYTIMPAAAAYVLRPTKQYMGKLILKYTGVAPPPEPEKPAEAEAESAPEDTKNS